MKWLDYHTHSSGCTRYIHEIDTLVVQSLQLGEQPHPRADYATIGLHPMLTSPQDTLQYSYEEQYQLLKNSIQTSPIPVIAIGECGWDKRSPLSEAQQNNLMELQAQLATDLRLPIIIHTVSYWHLLLKFQKEHPHLRLIVHGFRGHHTLMNQLTQAGIMLSLHPHSILHATELPRHFFIESDESSHNLYQLYQTAAALKNCDILELRDQIFKCFYHLHLSQFNN